MGMRSGCSGVLLFPGGEELLALLAELLEVAGAAGPGGGGVEAFGADAVDQGFDAVPGLFQPRTVHFLGGQLQAPAQVHEGDPQGFGGGGAPRRLGRLGWRVLPLIRPCAMYPRFVYDSPL